MQRTIRPEQVMALGFLLVIALGTVLLSLPFAAADGESIGLGNGLFTATSAVCVTGLVTVDTGTTFSLFGQIVLLCLFQVGGLGFMIFTTLVMVALGRRITLKDRVLIREAMSASTLSGLVRLTAWYGLLALGIEAMGALGFAIRFIPRLGWAKGIWYSLWHAVSAFCNAGFDLFGQFSSLTQFADEPVVLLTASALIIMGGVGFAVMMDVIHNRFRFSEFSLHSRITLVMSGALLLLGTVFFALVEWSRPETLGTGLNAGEKLANAFFQSVTMRTAGFNSIPLDKMHDSSKLLSVLLMLVGASSASTGGGVKVTTVAVLLMTVISVMQGDEDICAAKRRLPGALVRRALTIMLFYILILLGGTVVISLIEGSRFSMIDLLFETTSALATVGVSTVGTPNLKPASHCVLVPIMYIGRVGPLTMAMALASKQGTAKRKIRYPEETIIIG
ncbi:MAG: potassium transporter TrkG [Clostridiales bacterium]|nr:potassium transporter TrkG [Clostridiales bacterium]